MLTRTEHLGYLDCAVPGPTEDTLHGYPVRGLYFSANWCQTCSGFTPVLEKLYAAQQARGAKQLEVVLVSQCRMAKATQYYCLDMPWLSMWHDANDEAGMKAHTSALMAKYGITTIPALVLLDKQGRLICLDARAKCVADPEGTSFPWQQPSAPTRAPTWEARQGLVINFDPSPRARSLPEPTCARPHTFPGGVLVGLPVGSRAGTSDGQPTTNKGGAEVGFPVGFPAGKLVEQAPATKYEAPAPQAWRDTLGRAQAGAPAKKKRKRKSAPPDEVAEPPLPPKPNFEVEMNIPPEGKPTSLMQPQPLADVHPFTPTIKKWRHGIAVDCGPHWSWDVIEATVERGPHPTARTPEAMALFEEDIEYQHKAGFCNVIPWDEIKRLRPPNLKISPMAAVPQVGRRPRIILDLSFPVYQEVDGVVTATQASVNDTTALQASSAAVKEIGKVLSQLLTYMRDTPEGLHILMSKLDISDGFWRLIVRSMDCYNFAYVLPQQEGEPC
jgi:hypothetical protein